MTNTGQTTGRPTRGVRNRNPGNIRRVPSVRWQGMAAEQTDREFVTFVSHEMGVRALVRTLLTYFKQHHLASVRGIINRWAPPKGDRNGAAPGGEYRQNTAGYIDAVCRALGKELGRTVSADERLDIDSRAIMRPLVVAIIAHENAGYRYAASVIDEGLRLAGISDAKPKALLATGEVQGAVIAATPLALAGASEIAGAVNAARDNLAPVVGMSPILQTVVVVLSLIGCGLVIWSRLRQRQKTLA